MRMLVAVGFVAVTVAMLACATGGVPRARRGTRAIGGLSDAACVDLMGKRDDALLAAKILGGVGGVEALTAPVPQLGEVGQWAVGASAAGVAAVSVAVVWYGERKGAEFEEYCELTPREETGVADGGL